MLKMVIGNKKYSSWSLRGWLVLQQIGVPFEEIVVALDKPDTPQNIARHSPSGRVPCLLDGDTTVWDSLAICEYLNEKFPDKQLWPADPRARALARSVSAEMHSGFSALRNQMPMKILETVAGVRPSAETQADIDRIQAIWSDCLKRSGGPFLFGKPFTIADAMYAPVVSRFRTYGVAVQGAAAEYAETLWALPSLQAWVDGARKETLVAARYL